MGTSSLYDWSTTAASNASITGSSINWAENQAPSTINNSAREVMREVALWRDLLGGAKIATGTNTLTLTTGLGLAAYAQGMMFAFENTTQNTGAVTINVDTMGAKDIKKFHDVALASGDLEAAGIYVIAYEATAGNFQLLSPVANAPYSDPLTTRGDVITRGASATGRLAVGSANTVLKSDGTDPSWGSIVSANLAAALTPIGQHTIWIPAGAMEVAASTAPAASNVVEIGTSLFAARTIDFATGADDFCYFGIQMPKGWDAGTLVCQFVWSATGTTANTVLWAIAATSLGNDEVLTTAFPTPASPAADTNSTTADDLMISAEVTVTVGSTPTAEDYVIFEVSRDVSGDTLAEDARLHGIKIHYTIDTGNDS
jgi:hypothetical protein